MKYRGWILFWLLVIVVSGAIFQARAEDVLPQKEWVWGCKIRGRTLDGGCVLRKFTKVGESDPDTDTGENRILGFEPGNVQTNKKGDPIWERLNDTFHEAWRDKIRLCGQVHLRPKVNPCKGVREPLREIREV